MAKEGLFYAFLLWREKHIKEKHFILIISFLVGICTATSALLLKTLIHFFQHLLTGNFNVDEANYLYLLYPVVGILLAVLAIWKVGDKSVGKIIDLSARGISIGRIGGLVVFAVLLFTIYLFAKKGEKSSKSE